MSYFHLPFLTNVLIIYVYIHVYVLISALNNCSNQINSIIDLPPTWNISESGGVSVMSGVPEVISEKIGLIGVRWDFW